MKRNMNVWCQEVIESEIRQALPILTYPGIDLIGSSVMNMIHDGNTQAQCIQSLHERFPSAAAVTLMDLSVEAEAFGSEVKFSEKEAPTIVGRLVTNMEEVEQLAIPPVGTKRTVEYLKAARLAANAIHDRPVLGGVIGPFSLAGRLFGVSEAIVATRKHKVALHLLLKKCNSFLKEYIKAFKEAGCDGIIIAEPTAGLLSPAICDAFSSAYVKELVDELQDETFLIVMHNCGHTTQLVTSMLSTGCKAFHFGNAVDMADILPQIPTDYLVMGNVDPASAFRIGTKEMVYERTTELLRKTAGYLNFILSSGCDIPYGTPIENIEVFFNAMKEFELIKNKGENGDEKDPAGL